VHPRALMWLMTWVSLVLLWILWLGSAAPVELGTGAVMALVTTACASRLVPRLTDARPDPRWSVTIARKLLVGIPRDAIRVLACTQAGSVQRIPFAPLGGGAVERAHRNAAATAVSTPPNSFVIVVSEDSLTVHQLAEAPTPTDRNWPV
jgi:hypothetical protein